MSPKPSETSLKADELAKEIRSMLANKSPGIWGVSWEDATNLRSLLWKRLIKDEQKYVVLSLKENVVWISVSNKPKRILRETRERELLRICLAHIDDENLYDEIYAVLYDKVG